MIREKIDELIAQSTKAQLHKRTEVLRAVKNEFLRFQTAKNAEILDDKAEIIILNKMVKQRLESAEMYNKANRGDLECNELAEIEIIEGFLPKKATRKELEGLVEQWAKDHGYRTEEYNEDYGLHNPLTTYEIPKKEMGNVIKWVKSQLNNVDGKELSEIVKEYLV